LGRVGDAVRTATMGAPGHGREECAPVHSCGDEADASDSETVSVAVPEPAICAMALAGLACGGYTMCRRRKQA